MKPSQSKGAVPRGLRPQLLFSLIAVLALAAAACEAPEDPAADDPDADVAEDDDFSLRELVAKEERSAVHDARVVRMYQR